MTTSKPAVARLGEGAGRAPHRIEIARRVVHAHAGLLRDDGQLLDRGRPAHVGRYEDRVLPLLCQPAAQLSRGRRLARPLQAEQQDDARPRLRRRQPAGAVAEERQHLVAHDAHDLLRRRQALQNLLIDRLVADAIDERLDDLEVDVRLEQRHADFAQRGLDRLLGEADLTAQRPEDSLQAVTERIEHGPRASAPVTVGAPKNDLTVSGANVYRNRGSLD